MNWLDLVIIATIAWFVLAGFTAGILREAVTLLSVVLGVVLAGALYDRLADDLSFLIDSDRTASMAAFLAIFGAVMLGGQIAAVLLKSTASVLMLGPLDQFAGLLFGALKGFVLVEAALILFATYPVDVITRAEGGSLLTPIFLDGLPFLLKLLPHEFDNAVKSFPR